MNFWSALWETQMKVFDVTFTFIKQYTIEYILFAVGVGAAVYTIVKVVDLIRNRKFRKRMLQ